MVDLRTEIAGVHLRNPTLLASGFLDETGGSMLRVYNAGAGAVVTKSIGPEPREGYANPTIVELDGALLNAVGLPNPGIDEFDREVRLAVKGRAVVIGSVFGKDATEYAKVAAKMAETGVQAIELNLSCPHAKGLGTEIAQSVEAVREFTRAVKDAVALPVFPKLSPNVADIASFAVAAEEGGANGIVAINTVKGMVIAPELRMPVLANRYGGLSGPAIRPIGVRAVYDIYEKVSVPVIGVGGVDSGRAALEYIMAGARGVQIGTALVGQGLGVFERVTKELGSLLEEAGYRSVADAVGAAHG
ncbi:MAG TPA: dihydroorotate dehydrogenase [Thermoplasmata archaeon]|jgi:dihydroorotate dehydrogenase (NAD+) catalytic subunit